MPQDLPGFYFDKEKNRYFPIKGPIPGSKPNGTSSCNQVRSAPKLQQNHGSHTGVGKRVRSAKLLQERELDGKWLSFNKWKRNFQHEYQKLQVSQSMVWKYQDTKCFSLTALEKFYIGIQTPEGEINCHALLMGGIDSSTSLVKIGNALEARHYGQTCMPKCVWPQNSECEPEDIKAPSPIWRAKGAYTFLPSNVSHIDRVRKHFGAAAKDGLPHQLAIMTTLGSGAAGGSIYAVNLTEPLEFEQVFLSFGFRTSTVVSFTNTLWSADCHPNGTHVAVGTNRGAALVCLENQAVSILCDSKSDIFAQQFDSTGNVLLCGFRNGAIVPVDVRQKPESVNRVTELPKHKIPFSKSKNSKTSCTHGQVLTRKYFELKAKLMPSGVMFMPSAVCSLVSLYSYDQYFLASSMDGTVKLYDHRMYQRGAVQLYEGHKNTHSHLRMGVDPTESFVMSGGEDGYARIWSIKTGELLFESVISDSVISTVCWAGPGFEELTEDRESILEEHLDFKPPLISEGKIIMDTRKPWSRRSISVAVSSPDSIHTSAGGYPSSIVNFYLLLENIGTGGSRLKIS
ncbi:hypothetical protein H6P81_019458 [Aristolochia fimbriata]|uniref:Transducin/WD40 repeat-like superfamily protein n=1 Tax=Aristolochia fimbriata TaxID=158543 RepID=A0AAV7DWF1_ARIFI|nr:hypothetical protein H6P81_019458 [Aristolochia fimbriata]